MKQLEIRIYIWIYHFIELIDGEKGTKLVSYKVGQTVKNIILQQLGDRDE